MTKKIIMGADHAGFALKEAIKKQLIAQDYKVEDIGTYSTDSVDYPQYGYQVAQKIANNEAPFGILICGSGIGISIAANRNPRVRAALCHDENTAKLARQHNDANILALGARILDETTALKCTKVFLTTAFEENRHRKRVNQLNNKEETA